MNIPRPLLPLFAGLCLWGAGCSSSPPSTIAAPLASDAPSAELSVLERALLAAAESAESAPSEIVSDISPEAHAAAVEAELSRRELPAPAAAVVDRLTRRVPRDGQAHQVTDTTRFPDSMATLQTGAAPPRVIPPEAWGDAPTRGLTADGGHSALVERDWTGLVLVPITTAMAKAHTAQVRLTRVEAHPLNDGRIRVWTRVFNLSARPLPAEVACSFRMVAMPEAAWPPFYRLEVPPRGYRDVFFVSPRGEPMAYTVLVRSEGMVLR
jgi:hypothetical protein